MGGSVLVEWELVNTLYGYTSEVGVCWLSGSLWTHAMGGSVLVKWELVDTLYG